MQCTKSQGFGTNPNGIYSTPPLNLKGHPGIDIVCGWGSAIEWPIVGGKSTIYKFIDKSQPSNDGTGYHALFAIVERDGEVFEFSVGHPEIIQKKTGEISTGEVVASEGNRGIVYVNGVKITKEMQDAGDRRGSHRHWQKRIIKKTLSDDENGAYLTIYSPSGITKFQDADGYFYYTPMLIYRNGFNGCVDCQDELDKYESWKNTLPVSTPIIEPSDTEPVKIQKLTLLARILFLISEIQRWINNRK